MEHIYDIVASYFRQESLVPLEYSIDSKGLHIYSEHAQCDICILASKARVVVQSDPYHFSHSVILRHPQGYQESQYYLELARYLYNFVQPIFQYRSYPSSFRTRFESALRLTQSRSSTH